MSISTFDAVIKQKISGSIIFLPGLNSETHKIVYMQTRMHCSRLDSHSEHVWVTFSNP